MVLSVGLARESKIALVVTLLFNLLIVGCDGRGGTASEKIFTVTAEFGSGGNVSPTEQKVAAGDSAIFTIAQDLGYDIDGVEGCNGSLTGDTYTTAAIVGDCVVEARFILKTFSLNYTADESGAISGAKEQTVNYGADGQTVQAVPNVGFHFAGWSDGVTENPRTDKNITGDLSITASFAINSYQVEINATSGGVVSPVEAQVVNYGTPLNYEIQPDIGYHIETITGCDGALQLGTYAIAAVVADCTISVTFAINQYNLLYGAGVNGSVDGDVDQIVAHGADGGIVSAVANAGYHFSQWSDGSTENPRTDVNVAADISVTAYFAINTYDVIIESSVGGAVAPVSPQIAEYGSSVIYTLTPDTGYHIASVTGCDGSLLGSSYTTGPVASDCLVTVSFAIDQYSLTYLSDGNGVIQGVSSQLVDYGTDGSPVTAVANTGYHFVVWSDGVTSDSRTDLAIKNDMTVTANFAINTYSVTAAAANSNGIVTPQLQVIPYGGTASFVVQPNTGFGVLAVSGCNGALVGNIYTTGPIEADCAVNVSFATGYTVSGIVSGLTGSGLVLQNNGWDTWPISADGNFTFDTALVDGGAYTVSVRTQPSKPWQICNIANGVGAIAGANVVNVAVACFPENLVKAAPLSQEVELSWNDTGATVYNLYYSSVRDFNPDNYASYADGSLVGSVTSPYRVSGLTDGKPYYFVLEAVHANGQVRSLQVPARPNTLGFDGEVNTIAVDTGTQFIGGAFTRAAAVSGGGVPVDKRMGSAAFGDFPLVDGAVYAAVPDGTGGWYIGGDFTQVGGVPRNNVAHILPDGGLGAWSPRVNSTVSAIAVSGSVVYVGGAFSAVDSSPRNNLAAISTDGSLLDWSPNPASPVMSIAVNNNIVYIGGSIGSGWLATFGGLAAIDVNGQMLDWAPKIQGMWVSSLVVIDNVVYAGGDFTGSIGSKPIQNLMAITESGVVLDWAPNPNLRVSELSASNGVLYVSGFFTSVGNEARTHLVAFGSDRSLLNWSVDVNGSVLALIASDDAVYFSGAFDKVNGVARRGGAAVGIDGSLLDWNLNSNSRISVLSISENAVYVGGGFSMLGGVERNHLAAIGADGVLTPWNPDASGNVNTILHDGVNLYIGGEYATLGGGAHEGIASVAPDGVVSAWSPMVPGKVNAIVKDVNDGSIYIGGDFQTVNGISRSNLAAFDVGGVLRNDWVPEADLSVKAITINDGMVYVGGTFTSINGVKRDKIAAVGTNGILNPDWNPGVDSENAQVNAIQVLGSTVYVGGMFSSIAGEVRFGLATIDTGGQLLSWNPAPWRTIVNALIVSDSMVIAGGVVSTDYVPFSTISKFDVTGKFLDGYTSANNLVNTIAKNGDTLFAGGGFTNIEGVSRSYYSAIGLDGKPR